MDFWEPLEGEVELAADEKLPGYPPYFEPDLGDSL